MQHQLLLRFVFTLLFLSSSSLQASEKNPPTSITRGFAIRDCSCQTRSFDEDPKSLSIKKGEAVGLSCEAKGKDITCISEFPDSITCPKDCLHLKTQGPLSRKELKEAVIQVTTRSAKANYTSRVPSAVLKSIQSKYPEWLPALYNRTAPFIATFQLLEPFYFEIPLQLQGKPQDISIVYFFRDLDHLLKGDMDWSF